MNSIIWTNNRWEIDSEGIVWLCLNNTVLKHNGHGKTRQINVHAYVFKIRDKLIKA